MGLLWMTAADLARFDAAAASPAPSPAPPPAAAGADAAAPAGPDTGSDTAAPDADRARAFARLIRGEYKDQFTAEVGAILERRTKETAALRARLDAQRPVLEKLLARYNIPGGDMAALDRALDADSALWADAARDAGMTVDQYRRVRDVELENLRLRRVQRESAARDLARRQAALWQSQAGDLRGEYQSFDLAAELQNPAFRALLRAGAPMKSAYEVLHLADIKAGVARKGGQAREKQVLDHIRARGGRPEEGGGAGAGVTYSPDPAGLTPGQRDELARRAERGERISFR